MFDDCDENSGEGTEAAPKRRGRGAPKGSRHQHLDPYREFAEPPPPDLLEQLKWVQRLSATCTWVTLQGGKGSQKVTEAIRVTAEYAAKVLRACAPAIARGLVEWPDPEQAPPDDELGIVCWHGAVLVRVLHDLCAGRARDYEQVAEVRKAVKTALSVVPVAALIVAREDLQAEAASTKRRQASATTELPEDLSGLWGERCE